MLAHSHSQSFFPVFQHGMNLGSSHELQNHQMLFAQRPVPLEVQQSQLQQQIQMDIQQRHHQQLLQQQQQQQQQQGFMHASPSFEEQLLLARAHFDFEAQARAQMEAQSLGQPFVQQGLLSQPSMFMNDMYHAGHHPLQPAMNVDVMQAQPTLQSEISVHDLVSANEQAFELPIDEQDVLGYSMENFYRSTNVSARQRTQQACEKCRDRKTKCSGTRPTCQRCSDRGLSCVWAAETRTRGISRQFRHGRMTSIDYASDRSLPGSPMLKSAPATQTHFAPFGSGRDFREKRGSWHGGQGSPVVRGERALSVIGGPIESLPGADDGWEEISQASIASPEIIQSVTQARARATTVSVAHMARSRDLHKPLQIGPFQVTSNAHISPTAESNESSPPMSGESLPRTASECSEPPILMLEDTPSSPLGEIHAPQPSYDATLQLSEEMLKLLHFPVLESKSASVVNESEDNSVTPSTTTDLMSQFLTEDIFASCPVTD